MRQIKFRVWSIKDQFMHTVSELDWTVAYGRWHGPGVGSGIFYLDPTFEGKTSQKKDSVLMQYTGLKDKNDVEIYDGDILREPDGVLCKVFFDKDLGQWYCECKIDNIPLNEFIEDSEIIGNIHKNKGLC